MGSHDSAAAHYALFAHGASGTALLSVKGTKPGWWTSEASRTTHSCHDGSGHRGSRIICRLRSTSMAPYATPADDIFIAVL